MSYVLACVVLFHGITIPSERVDLIEINHVYYKEFKERWFTQVIFWRFDNLYGTFHVAAWRWSFKHDIREHQHGRHVYLWNDGKILRQVVAKQFIETASNYDREMAERKVCPENQRRGLRCLTP